MNLLPGTTDGNKNEAFEIKNGCVGSGVAGTSYFGLSLVQITVKQTMF